MTSRLFRPRSVVALVPRMSSAPVSRASLSHIERTAGEPRDEGLHRMILYESKRINDTINLYKLRPIEGEPKFTFLPGQWLDVHIPGIPKAGGFTITSSPTSLSRPYPSEQPQPTIPRESNESSDPESDADILTQLRQIIKPQPKYPHIELAIQKSPDNPAAAWFWKHTDQAKVAHLELSVRVGGSFVWPPPATSISREKIRRVVFVAGGVGVNPLMSMLKAIYESRTAEIPLGFEVIFLYSTKLLALYAYKGTSATHLERKIHPSPLGEGEEYLFLNRLAAIFVGFGSLENLKLFLTPPAVPQLSREMAIDSGLKFMGDDAPEGVRLDGSRAAEVENPKILETRGGNVPYQTRRIEERDLEDTLGNIEDRDGTVVYVCGIPTMTDWVVECASQAEGMSKDRVFCEKWW